MDEQFRKEDVGFCSEDLVSKLQLLLKEQYGKEIDRAEAQQIGLRIAELVFIKEKEKMAKEPSMSYKYNLNKNRYQSGDTSKLLAKYGIAFERRGRELLVDCFFSDCDSDSKPHEHHLSFNDETGLYRCFKCEARGNYITLKRFLKGQCNE